MGNSKIAFHFFSLFPPSFSNKIGNQKVMDQHSTPYSSSASLTDSNMCQMCLVAFLEMVSCYAEENEEKIIETWNASVWLSGISLSIGSKDEWCSGLFRNSALIIFKTCASVTNINRWQEVGR